jgi:(p)ppGpp synthase/HD superfamily hydrolase
MAANGTIQEEHIKHLAVMRGWLDGRGYHVAADALEFVRRMESGTRKDGQTPKFDHQLSLTRYILTLVPHLQFPEETITAAFLHDALEDHGDVTQVMLASRFGVQVANAVWTLTKKTPAGLIKSYDLYFDEIAQCPIASVVKPVDRAHNVQTMPGVFTPEKQRSYLEEVDTHFFPLLKKARRNFPRQFGAYENVKFLLRCQTELLRLQLGV